MTLVRVLVSASILLLSITCKAGVHIMAVPLSPDYQGAEFSALAAEPAATDYWLPPSITSVSRGVKTSTIVIGFACIDDATGGRLSFCNIGLTWHARQFDGGHNHDDGNRPAGTFVPALGWVDPNTGWLVSTYTAPEPSGIIDVHVEGGSFGPIQPIDITIGVRIDNLVALAGGTGYTLTGSDGVHPDNHYGTQDFVDAVTALAEAWHRTYAAEILRYNDMSLVQGGLFDAQITGQPWTQWNPGHREHRLGVSLDVGLVTLDRRAVLRQLCATQGLGIYVEGNHWHVRQ